MTLKTRVVGFLQYAQGDDVQVYLQRWLAASWRVNDTLFDPVSGHRHNGQGTNGPIVSGGGGISMIWRGAWAASTAYSKDDGVSYAGSSYIALNAVGPTSTPPDQDPANWALLAQGGAPGGPGPEGPPGPAGPPSTVPGPPGPAGLNWRGDWQNIIYLQNDAVYYNGSSYIALDSLSGPTYTPPDEDTDNWGPLALEGATGATGAVGPAGSQGVPGINWRGTWAGAPTVYANNDGVFYQGSSWMCVAPNVGSPPPSSSWAYLAQQGDSGPIGAQGPPGQGVPTGGSAGEVLSKIDATNYNTQWIAVSGGGLTLPLQQNLTFLPDNTYDIAVSGANRPRDLWLGRNLNVTGTSQLMGNVGIGLTTLVPSAALTIQSPASLLNGTTQWQIIANGTFNSQATVQAAVIQAQLVTQVATYTITTGYGVFAAPPALGAGTSITNLSGVTVGNQGATGVTNAYGVYIQAQSGAASANVGLHNAGTSELVGAVTVGVAPTATLFLGDTGHSLQYANALVTRYMVPATGYHSMEQPGGYADVYAAAFTVNSSLENKRALEPLSAHSALETVLDPRVTPLAYTYIPDSSRSLGFIAEDMVQVVPEVVKLNADGAPEAINLGALVPVLWGAVRELTARLSALENNA